MRYTLTTDDVGGLQSGVTYVFRRVNDDTLSVESRFGVSVNITSVGTGTATLQTAVQLRRTGANAVVRTLYAGFNVSPFRRTIGTIQHGHNRLTYILRGDETVLQISGGYAWTPTSVLLRNFSMRLCDC
jgi:hypothetical protein